MFFSNIESSIINFFCFNLFRVVANSTCISVFKISDTEIDDLVEDISLLVILIIFFVVA